MSTIVSDFDIYNLSSSVVTNVSENSTNISTDVNLIVKDLVNNYLETKKVVSKQSRQKRAVGTPVEMTELEHATLDGLVRVWDCGKIRFSFS